MSPPSGIASQIFGAIWSLSLLGAVNASREPDYPFDGTWRRFVERHGAELNELRELLCDVAGFDRPVADMLLADAPWRGRGQPEYLTDKEALSAELAAMLGGRPEDIAAVKSSDPLSLIPVAARRQLAHLFDGIMHAQFVAETAGRSMVATRLEDVLQLAGQLVFGSGSTVGGGSELSLASVLDEWEREYGYELSRQDHAFYDWLRSRISALRGQ